PEPRLPCVLLLDTSGSMDGRPIEELNAGLLAYRDAVLTDPLATKRVEVALVTFGGTVRVLSDFTPIHAFFPPRLEASGETPMGAAIQQGLELLRQRKEAYRSHGIAYFRPWLFLITDGVPTDDWKAVPEQVRQGEDTKALSFFTVGVGSADFGVLRQ